METYILIPPSEGKSSLETSSPLSLVDSITSKLLNEIKKAEPKKLYDLKNRALEDAIEINSNILNSSTCPAVLRYTGVVYKAINYETLKNKELFNERVRIVSALFGLIKPQKNIPNYRLKIDKLNADKLWLNKNSSKLKDCFVIDLLPQAHKKTVKYDNGIEVEFIVIKKGKKIPAGHNGKLIKGKFVRWLIENDITSPEDFYKFKQEGYIWKENSFIKEIS